MDDLQKGNEEIVSQLPVDENPAPAIKQGWLRALLFVFASIICTGITSSFGLVAAILFSGLDLSLLLTNATELIQSMDVLSLTIIQLFTLGGQLFAVWLFRKFIDKKSFVSLGFSFTGHKNDFLWGLGWGAGLITFGFFILYFCGFITIIEIKFYAFSFFTCLVLYCIVSLNEELMIRGYILNNLSRSINKYIALAVSSLLFAVMHLANANVSVLAFINLLIAGILLGIYYIHKQNLWFSIGMHLTWNFFQGSVFGFEVSGTETKGIILQDIQGNDLITGGQFGFEGSLIATIAMIVIIFIIHFKYRGKS